MKQHDCDHCETFETAQPLADLRTPVPLRDSDFAAIRARVMSEAAQPRRAWFAFALRLAFAIAVIAAIGVGVFVKTRPAPPAHAPVIGLTVDIPPLPAMPPPITIQPAPMPSARVARREHYRRPARVPTRAAAPGDEMRIHIQTADPDVRIIWIVNPTTPKEESES